MPVPAVLVPLLVVVVFLLHRRQEFMRMIQRYSYIHFNLSTRQSSEIAKDLVVRYRVCVPAQVAELHKIRQVFYRLLSWRTFGHSGNFFNRELYIFSIMAVAAR